MSLIALGQVVQVEDRLMLTAGESSTNRPFEVAFREARVRAGLTQDQLGELARISRRTIIRWEAGQARPWIPELKSVLQVLQLSDDASSSLMAMLDTNRAQLEVDPKSVGRHASLLRMGRARAGIKAADLAKEMRRDVSTVARWESGSSRPTQKEAERLYELLGIAGHELDEFADLASGPDPMGDIDLEETVLGFAWPWSKESYRLFDVRHLSLIHQFDAPNQSDGHSRWHCLTKVAYAWMLCACRRHGEAKQFATDAVLGLESDQQRRSRLIHAARLVVARCDVLVGTTRASTRALRTLRSLEGKPLSWPLLAARFDGLAEAHAMRGDFQEALACCDVAESAAAHCGHRLTRLLKFNRCYVLLMSGNAAAARESLPEFSELTPLNDACEMLLASSIERQVGNLERAHHWHLTAAQIIEEFELHPAFSGGSEARWNIPPLSVLCDTF